ncbi:hypothetical protein OX284_013405 [Flavobacterium sp. SUN046]|uniref:hypothetical protein n=1 Tax=Flavobacterium sp. SUN046 TaxID=3002440 RepID=UPI002DBC0DA0|nr:hypothetical protein [Flavobacterium sp. SUN046]MEC4050433.1 hypothetical protein [Flavobacterium sp. SUN046]
MKKLILVALLAVTFQSQAQLGGLLKKASAKVESKILDKGASATGTNNQNSNTGSSNQDNQTNLPKGETMGGASGKLKLFKEEKMDFQQYKNHIGQVCFSHQDFDRTIPESAYIKSFKIGEKVSGRCWFANSSANSIMLQLEANGVSVDEINKSREEIAQEADISISMYMDGELFMRISSSPNRSAENSATLPTDRFDLNEGTDRKFYGEFLLDDLIKRTDLMTGGTHKLRFEAIPVIVGYGLGKGVNFKPIAVSEIDMIVPETIPTKVNCFPYQAVEDVAIENEVLKVIKRNNPAAFKVIINSQIKIERDDYGNILNKNFIAAIICKTDKKVWYDVYRFDKLFNGTGYESAVISKSADNFTYPRDWKINKECLKFLK